MGQVPAGTNQAPKMHYFGEIAPTTLEQIPLGAFKSQLEGLAPEVQAIALKRLDQLKVPTNNVASLNVDKNGMIIYACQGLVNPNNK